MKHGYLFLAKIDIRKFVAIVVSTTILIPHAKLIFKQNANFPESKMKIK